MYESYMSYVVVIYLEINSFELVLGRVNNGCGLLCGTIDFVESTSFDLWLFGSNPDQNGFWSKPDLTPIRVNFRPVQKVRFLNNFNFPHSEIDPYLN